MTNDQAIKSIKRHMAAHGIGIYPHIFIKEALDMAIEALRAKQTKMDRSRWEGCEYCGDPQPYKDCVLPDGTERILCSQDGLFGDCYINERTIKFCPFCGKPLTEEAWAELDRRINGGKTD